MRLNESKEIKWNDFWFYKEFDNNRFDVDPTTLLTVLPFWLTHYLDVKIKKNVEIKTLKCKKNDSTELSFCIPVTVNVEWYVYFFSIGWHIGGI